MSKNTIQICPFRLLITPYPPIQLGKPPPTTFSPLVIFKLTLHFTLTFENFDFPLLNLYISSLPISHFFILTTTQPPEFQESLSRSPSFQEMSGSSSTNTSTTSPSAQKKYKGVRRRKWGKWVSEIRVPGSQERLWLGSYSSPEAAAVAHDVASYCLKGQSSVDNLNFPDLMLPASVRAEMSPKSIQKSASDAGMAIDAQMIMSRFPDNETSGNEYGGGGSGRRGSSSVVVLGSEAEQLRWEEVVGGYENWSGNESQSREGNEDGLSISVEDYF